MSRSQATAGKGSDVVHESQFTLNLVVESRIVFSDKLSAVPCVGSRFYALADSGPVYAEVETIAWTLATDRREVAALGKRIDRAPSPPPADPAVRNGNRGAGPAKGYVRVHVVTDDEQVIFTGDLEIVPQIGDYVLGYLPDDPSGVVIRVTEETWFMHPAQGGPAVSIVGERPTVPDKVRTLLNL